MEPEKCTKCGLKFEEPNTTDIYKQNTECSTNEICQKYFEEKEIEEDYVEYLESNISESNGSENQIALTNLNTEESDAILNLQECSNNSDFLKSDVNTYGNVGVVNSQNVIIGNVTYIKGPIHITQVSTNIEEQNVSNQFFFNDSEFETSLNIISRNNWMAQPAKLVTPLPETAQYVIIAHTATEAGYTQPQNALLVKLIQTFHIESRNWDDIAYNFLVGCDGNIYVGRGWNIQGAHTYGYNKKSICIAFIGCFMNHLPNVSALKAAFKLIIQGVKLGFIPENYTLVGYCQCTPIESPGITLFQEIKKWPRWRELSPEDAKF